MARSWPRRHKEGLMKIKENEKNYGRLAREYNLDIYEHKGNYTLFDSMSGDIYLSGMRTETEAVNETIKVFNENIMKKAYREGREAKNLFTYHK